MKENKNIERLFQEKFKDFEVTPPEISWNTIASKIEEKKKKRRVIPFWFKASGIAASLIIGLFLILNQKNKPILSNENKTIVFEKDAKDTNNKNLNIPKDPIVIKNDIKIVENDINSNSTKEPVSNKNNSTNQNKFIQNPKHVNIKKNNPTIVSSTINEKRVLEKEKNTLFITKQNPNNIEFINTLNDSVSSNSLVEIKKTKPINDLVNADKEIVAKSLSIENTGINLNKNNTKTIKNSSFSENLIVHTEKKSDYVSDINNNVNSKENIEYVSEKQQSFSNSEKIVNTTLSDIEKKNKKKSIINDKNNPLLHIEKLNMESKDSTTVITQVESEVNALEQLLKEKEEGRNADEKEEEKRSKWAVSSNAAPVYFNSISNGSPIDEQFASNEKSYAQTLSYGLGIQYAITKKISIRSGVNAININYNTNDVYYTSTLGEVNSSSLNIAKNGNAQNLILRSSPATPSASLLSADVDNMVDSNLANLNQEMGYIEVPLEMTYKILDKKIGIELIGGMSTLFLNKNNVSLISRGSEMTIGEANNLNNIHFSSNVGLGFNYNFWKAFNLNFQPVFKYQINTFNSNSGNFKPYIIGLYSGVSFNF